MQLSELKHIKRFKEIAAVLIKYGFDEIVQRLDLPGIEIVRKISPVEEALGFNERIRRALEGLGPTFVKFGQILSLRPDLLPGDLVNELEKLQEDESAVELAEIEDVLEESHDYNDRYRALSVRFSRIRRDRLSVVRCFGFMVNRCHIAGQEILNSKLNMSIRG